MCVYGTVPYRTLEYRNDPAPKSRISRTHAHTQTIRFPMPFLILFFVCWYYYPWRLQNIGDIATMSLTRIL